jgi:hypothetical protein
MNREVHVGFWERAEVQFLRDSISIEMLKASITSGLLSDNGHWAHIPSPKHQSGELDPQCSFHRSPDRQLSKLTVGDAPLWLSREIFVGGLTASERLPRPPERRLGSSVLPEVAIVSDPMSVERCATEKTAIVERTRSCPGR